MNRLILVLPGILMALVMGLVACGNGSSDTDTGGGTDPGGSTDPGVVTDPGAWDPGGTDAKLIATGSITATTGGTVTSVDEALTLTFPSGAVPADTEVTVVVIHKEADLPEALRDAGIAFPSYRLEPSGLKLDRPARVSIRLDDATFPEDTQVATFSGTHYLTFDAVNGEEDLGGPVDLYGIEQATVIDAITGTVSVEGAVNHFSFLVKTFDGVRYSLGPVPDWVELNAAFSVDATILTEVDPSVLTYELAAIANRWWPLVWGDEFFVDGFVINPDVGPPADPFHYTLEFRCGALTGPGEFGYGARIQLLPGDAEMKESPGGTPRFEYAEDSWVRADLYNPLVGMYFIQTAVIARTFCGERKPGPCCFRYGSVPCSDLSVEECTEAGGSFQGVDLTCEDVDHCTPPGACCFENGACLEDTSSVTCASFGGAFHPEQDCDQSCSGSCCAGDLSCNDATSRFWCEGMDGTWNATRGLCQPEHDGTGFCRGACCREGQACKDQTVSGECDDPGQNFHLGETCIEACPAPCCTNHNECSMLTLEECAALDGKWKEGYSSCETTDCSPYGACCIIREGGTTTCIDTDGWEWMFTEEFCLGMGESHPGITTTAHPVKQYCKDIECDPPQCDGQTVDANGAASVATNGLDLDFIDLVNLLICALNQIIPHSDGTQTKVEAGDETSSHARGALPTPLTGDQLDDKFENTMYPCGAGDHGYTLCPGASVPMPEGDYHTLVNIMKAGIPLADPTHYYQYGFVFDSDGIGSNNYQPSASFPSDFFKDSDRWYEANYDPVNGWSMKVTDARDGAFLPVDDTAARIILRGNTIALVVPAGEFTVAKPSYRMTSFRHLGDYGMSPPHEWAADTEPLVSVGLSPYDPM